MASDLHLSWPGPLDAFRAGPELAAFVGSLEPKASALVVAGDFFDLLTIPNRPAVLDLEGAPLLLRSLLEELARSAWGRELFSAFGAFVRGGGRLVVLPRAPR